MGEAKLTNMGVGSVRAVYPKAGEVELTVYVKRSPEAAALLSAVVVGGAFNVYLAPTERTALSAEKREAIAAEFRHRYGQPQGLVYGALPVEVHGEKPGAIPEGGE